MKKKLTEARNCAITLLIPSSRNKCITTNRGVMMKVNTKEIKASPIELALSATLVGAGIAAAVAPQTASAQQGAGNTTSNATARIEPGANTVTGNTVNTSNNKDVQGYVGMPGTPGTAAVNGTTCTVAKGVVWDYKVNALVVSWGESTTAAANVPVIKEHAEKKYITEKELKKCSDEQLETACRVENDRLERLALQRETEDVAILKRAARTSVGLVCGDNVTGRSLREAENTAETCRLGEVVKTFGSGCKKAFAETAPAVATPQVMVTPATVQTISPEQIKAIVDAQLADQRRKDAEAAAAQRAAARRAAALDAQKKLDAQKNEQHIADVDCNATFTKACKPGQVTAANKALQAAAPAASGAKQAAPGPTK
jgi:hypothetical protein